MMSIRLAALTALATSFLALTSIAAADPTASKQRIAIVSKKGDVHAFSLLPLNPGALTRDSGSASWAVRSNYVIYRNGQQVEVNDVIGTFTGEHGALMARFRLEWTEAGNGYSVGAGTWKVIRGTGDYKGLAGNGRSSHAWVTRGPVSWRVEGLLSQP
jgi:hypothetical protein